MVGALLDAGAEDAPDTAGDSALKLGATGGNLPAVAKLLYKEDGVWSLTRAVEGFGLGLDSRGAVASYTGEGRAAEAASVPLRSVIVAVDGTRVLGKESVIGAIRAAQAKAKSSGGSGAEPTIAFTLMTPEQVVDEADEDLLVKMEGRAMARKDVVELRARIDSGVEAALEIPESHVVTAINRIWPDKHHEVDEEGNIVGAGGTWRAPEFVVPDLEGFELKAYVSRAKDTIAP